jgi:hypothetical protein
MAVYRTPKRIFSFTQQRRRFGRPWEEMKVGAFSEVGEQRKEKQKSF